MSHHYLNKVKLNPGFITAVVLFKPHMKTFTKILSFDLGYKKNMNSLLSSLFALHTISSE